ncbi:MAG: LptF/LptG family permease [Acidobacteriota bacterium]|nr:LptF/LptG family permease [Blastocatellia bacterium]MDW8240406.1 LptF/LptG family permease [Acidobacteriota bacterium]
MSYKRSWFRYKKTFWYVVKEVLPYFVLSLLFTTSIVTINELAQFSELFVKRNVPLGLTGTLLVSVIINVLVITIPLSLLIGIMIAFARLSSDNEIISLMATGISQVNLLIPLTTVSFGALLITGFLTFQGIPYATKTILAIQAQLALHEARTRVKSRIFDTRFENCMLYIEDVNRINDQWLGILISMESNTDQILITGQKGVLETQDENRSVLHVFNGSIHRLEQATNQKYTYHTENFSSYHVRIDSTQKNTALDKLRENSSKSIKAASIGSLLNYNNENKKLYLKAKVELHKRLLLPLSCLLFTPFALLLGLSRSGLTPAKGAIIAVLLASVYYFLLFIGEKLTLSETLPPFPAMWIGTIVLIASGVLAFNWKHLIITRRNGFGITKALSFFNTFAIGSVVTTRTSVSDREKQKQKRGIIPGPPFDKYLISHFFVFYFLASAFLLSIYLTFTLFELSPDLVENNIHPAFLLRYLLLLIPQVLTQITAPCVLVASLITTSIIVRTNQVLALVTSGISVYRITLPLFVGAALLLLMTFFTQAYVIPKTGPYQDNLRFYIKKGRFPTLVERSLLPQSRNWIYAGKNEIYHFSFFDQRTQSLRNLLVLEIEDRSNMVIKKRINAEVAKWNENAARWLLSNAVVWEFSNSQVTRETHYEQAVFDLSISPDFLLKELPKPEFLTFNQLRSLTDNIQQGGYDVTEMRIALHRYIALPFSCVVMMLIGTSFGFTVGPRGVLVSAGSGVLLGVAFWLGLELFEKFGKYDYMPPSLSAWGMNIILGAIGIYGLFHTRT